MKAEELRIGNWYNWYADGKYYQFQVEAKDFTMGNMPNYEGIPLTEEWLLKFGFAKEHNKYLLDNFRFHVEKPCNYDGFLFCENHVVITDKIQYCHQLQNLYYALTQTELQLTEKQNLC